MKTYSISRSRYERKVWWHRRRTTGRQEPCHPSCPRGQGVLTVDYKTPMMMVPYVSYRAPPILRSFYLYKPFWVPPSSSSLSPNTTPPSISHSYVHWSYISPWINLPPSIYINPFGCPLLLPPYHQIQLLPRSHVPMFIGLISLRESIHQGILLRSLHCFMVSTHDY
jgi:hypothetical protein